MSYILSLLRHGLSGVGGAIAFPLLLQLLENGALEGRVKELVTGLAVYLVAQVFSFLRISLKAK